MCGKARERKGEEHVHHALKVKVVCLQGGVDGLRRTG